MKTLNSLILPFDADRTHHGKEEDILFRELAQKPLSTEDKNIMNKPVEDHVFVRKTVGTLFDANTSFIKRNKGSIKEIISTLEKLVALYPRYIYVEEKEFFYPCMEYFSREEQDDMLQEFWEFDQKMIYERHIEIMNDLEHQNIFFLSSSNNRFIGNFPVLKMFI